jgi:hypothetical protein
MVKVFISHAWGENTEYERFVDTLDQVFDHTKWINLSIPRSAAIDVLREELARQENELTRLKEELWRARARLRDPSLPDAISRTVWKDGESREVETVGSVRAKIHSLQAALESYLYIRQDLGLELPEDLHVDRKNASAHISAYPALSAAIRDRLQKAEIVFVLLTSMVRLHEWVDHEIRLSAMLEVPIIGVKTQFVVSQDIHVDCDEVIDWSKAQIERIVGRFCSRQSGPS